MQLCHWAVGFAVPFRSEGNNQKKRSLFEQYLHSCHVCFLLFVGNVWRHLRWEPAHRCLWTYCWLSWVLLEGHASPRNGASQCIGGPAGWEHFTHEPLRSTGMWDLHNNMFRKIQFTVWHHLHPVISSNVFICASDLLNVENLSAKYSRIVLWKEEPHRLSHVCLFHIFI